FADPMAELVNDVLEQILVRLDSKEIVQCKSHGIQKLSKVDSK
nr:hypothetical protein [Tanacetum cinerariifolium]